MEIFDADVIEDEIETTNETFVKIKKPKNNKKGNKMAKEKKVEVVIEEVLEVSSLDELKSELNSIQTKSSKTLNDITSAIQLSDVEKIQAVEDLKNFIATQEELSRPYGIMQQTKNMLTKLPWLGEKIEKAYETAKKRATRKRIC